MSGRGGGSDAAFWVAVVFTGLMLVGLNWKVRTESETASSVEAELVDARSLLERLQVVEFNPKEWQRETDNLRVQLGQLSTILPPTAGGADRALRAMFDHRGLRVSRVETLDRRPTSHPHYQQLELRLGLEPTSRTWLEGLEGIHRVPLLFGIKRLEVTDPRNPGANLTLDMVLIVGR